MTISLKNIVPQFLEKEKIEKSAIWKQEKIFNKGEKIQIVAPSGSGKTSLIHFLYGMRKDYDGDIIFENKILKKLPASTVATIRATQISIVFQDLRLFKDFTVLQNLHIKRSLAAFHKISLITEMANRLGIENKLSQTAGTCSYGEQQRIAIVRAMQQPFDFIVMDEPFSHLDESNAQKAMQLIEEEAAKRSAAIIIADLQPIPFFKADKTLYL